MVDARNMHKIKEITGRCPPNNIKTFEKPDQIAAKGRPFDSEGGGGLALFGNKFSDLENAGNK